MVFGRKRQDWKVWRSHYAWRPVRMLDGRWAWLEWVEITGYVENPKIFEDDIFNMRLARTSFCARMPSPRTSKTEESAS